jgi:peptide/nickel transport system substrate-binding protein
MSRSRTTLALSVGLAVGLATGSALAQKKGGDFVAAQPAGTNTLDPHFTASAAARNMMLSMYETLVTIDENTAPIPMLAEKWDIAEDGLTYRFHLRKGVKFHNGKEMTAADVKASLERFGKISPEKTTLGTLGSIETPDPYTVVLKMTALDTSFIDRMGSPASPVTIIPLEEAGKEVNKTNMISTGPYALVEWQPDTHIKMKRHEGYAANAAFKEATGLGGKKTAWFDTVTLRIIREASARVAALEAGQVHHVEGIPTPSADRLASNPRLKVIDLIPSSQPIVLVNTATAPTNDLKLRQAIQAAIDIKEIMTAATDNFFQLSHAWTYTNNPYYDANAGKAQYNVNDMNKAKALLKQSNYKGEPIVLLTNKDYQYMYKSAVLMSEQLKELGVNIKLEVLDWPTMADMSRKPQGWNLAASGFAIQPFVGPYSYLKLFWGPTHVGFAANDPVLDAAWKKFNGSLKFEDRKAAWGQIQARLAEEVHLLKLGDQGTKLGAVKNLAGFKPYAGANRWWDVWFD